MDKVGLVKLVAEKDQRIQDLEKLVEEQKRLRFQVATQVEEKAARIKDWVANKLKELENQNKHLRDQNKKQEEVVESLSSQLAALNLVSSTQRVKVLADKFQLLDQTPPLETNKDGQPTKFRRLKLNKHTDNSTSKESSMTIRVYSKNDEPKKSNKVSEDCKSESANGDSRDVLLERRQPYTKTNLNGRCESPVYDSVTIEQINRKNSKMQNQEIVKTSNDTCSIPPLPPLHQSDRWELQLYDLAEQSFSTLMKKVTEEKTAYDSHSQYDSIDLYYNSNSDKEISNSKKSSSSLYTYLNSLVKPSFTTIDYFLSSESGVDQSFGTPFERALTKLMINNSFVSKNNSSEIVFAPSSTLGCIWSEYSILLYSDRPITQPLTNLPNETLRMEAIESFKSILLFTQVPIEPVAIDYHVSLMQNCFERFLKYPELRNEFFAQLIKQCTYVYHRCGDQRLSSGSSGCSSTKLDQLSSLTSMSPSSCVCQFITDTRILDSIPHKQSLRLDSNSNLSHKTGAKDKNEKTSECHSEDLNPPTQSQLLQVMQILAIAVSLNLPKGRMRWWLTGYLRKSGNTETNFGKYALYTSRAIERTIANGPRENVPSRTEIMSILLRNPFDHSSPHSLPVNFTDGTYLVVEADGSTTIEEFMATMIKSINIRHSSVSDFHLFADDPTGLKDLYILEPRRKVLDIVGWWEQMFRRQKSGRFQSTKSIKLFCKKRLLLRVEDDETYQERFLIVHQISQEVASQRIPMTENLALELAALMAQLSYGDYEKSKDPKLMKCILEKVCNFLPNNISSQLDDRQNTDFGREYYNELITRWLHLSGKSAQDCARVYLNCIRHLKFANYT